MLTRLKSSKYKNVVIYVTKTSVDNCQNLKNWGESLLKEILCKTERCNLGLKKRMYFFLEKPIILWNNPQEVGTSSKCELKGIGWVCTPQRHQWTLQGADTGSTSRLVSVWKITTTHGSFPRSIVCTDSGAGWNTNLEHSRLFLNF